MDVLYSLRGRKQETEQTRFYISSNYEFNKCSPCSYALVLIRIHLLICVSHHHLTLKETSFILKGKLEANYSSIKFQRCRLNIVRRNWNHYFIHIQFYPPMEQGGVSLWGGSHCFVKSPSCGGTSIAPPTLYSISSSPLFHSEPNDCIFYFKIPSRN